MLLGRNGCIDLGPRKKEREDGPVVDGVFAAAVGELALVTSDDTSGNPQAKSRAVEVFGCVKGLEETRFHGRRHAVASIGDGDANAMPGFWIVGGVISGVVSAYDEVATARAHGVYRIGDEIIEHLANVVFEAKNGR